MLRRRSYFSPTAVRCVRNSLNEDESFLCGTIARLAAEANIGMPEVAIYDAEEMNAFATGMNRNNALVAVSTGLLQQMNRDEIEAVLAHEISHIANGDMVTLTLIQGVVNTFVIFFARVVAYAADQFVQRGSGEVSWVYYVATFFVEIIFSILASIIVMWFSRQREFRADAGSASLVGKDKMIAALQRLQHGQLANLPDAIAVSGIAQGHRTGFIAGLFMSHPSIEDRIVALQNPHQ